MRFSGSYELLSKHPPRAFCRGRGFRYLACLSLKTADNGPFFVLLVLRQGIGVRWGGIRGFPAARRPAMAPAVRVPPILVHPRCPVAPRLPVRRAGRHCPGYRAGAVPQRPDFRRRHTAAAVTLRPTASRIRAAIAGAFFMVGVPPSFALHSMKLPNRDFVTPNFFIF